MNPWSKLLNWYFSKKSLPYWCIFLIDGIMALLSGLFTYWVFHKTTEMFTHRVEVLYTSLFYMAISWISARVFRTYSGIIRYSSFVDLLRVAYANFLSMLIALVATFVFERYEVNSLSAMNQTETVVTFVGAMLLMWCIRIVVKTLNDVTKAEHNTMRVMIYGALTGGIGLAKTSGVRIR